MKNIYRISVLILLTIMTITIRISSASAQTVTDTGTGKRTVIDPLTGKEVDLSKIKIVKSGNIIQRGNTSGMTREQVLELERFQEAQQKEIQSAFDMLYSGKIDQAVVIFKKYLSVSGYVPIGIEGMAEANRLTGNTAEAIRYYRQLIYPAPDKHWGTSRTNHLDLRMKFALLLRDAGQYEEAWNNYKFGMNAYSSWRLPQPPSILASDVYSDRFVQNANLAIAEFLGSGSPEAIPYVKAAIAADPTNGLPYLYLGNILGDSDLKGSKAAYEKAIRIGHGAYVKQAEKELEGVKYHLSLIEDANEALQSTPEITPNNR